jgi:hypothetical protein
LFKDKSDSTFLWNLGVHNFKEHGEIICMLKFFHQIFAFFTFDIIMFRVKKIRLSRTTAMGRGYKFVPHLQPTGYTIRAKELAPGNYLANLMSCILLYLESIGQPSKRSFLRF